MLNRLHMAVQGNNQGMTICEREFPARQKFIVSNPHCTLIDLLLANYLVISQGKDGIECNRSGSYSRVPPDRVVWLFRIKACDQYRAEMLQWLLHHNQVSCNVRWHVWWCWLYQVYMHDVLWHDHVYPGTTDSLDPIFRVIIEQYHPWLEALWETYVIKVPGDYRHKCWQGWRLQQGNGLPQGLQGCEKGQGIKGLNINTWCIGECCHCKRNRAYQSWMCIILRGHGGLMQ
jgi:hypothetical protein